MTNPNEAVEALAKELLIFRFGFHLVEGESFKLDSHRKEARGIAERFLSADDLRDHFYKEFREALLSDEAIEAAAEAVDPDDLNCYERIIRTALDHIQSGGDDV